MHVCCHTPAHIDVCLMASASAADPRGGCVWFCRLMFETMWESVCQDVILFSGMTRSGFDICICVESLGGPYVHIKAEIGVLVGASGSSSTRCYAQCVQRRQLSFVLGVFCMYSVCHHTRLVRSICVPLCCLFFLFFFSASA